MDSKEGDIFPDDPTVHSVTLDDNSIYIRIFIAELNVQRCLPFRLNESIAQIKQKVLSSLSKELKDSFNYGLFCPPFQGKAGKFLDEERPLRDYPLPGPVGYLELKYKRRVYKMTNADEKHLKQLHTRGNLKRFLDHVANSQIEKINRMCQKGLDPNFQDADTGETPLTMAAAMPKPVKIMAALVNGGAHLDFRSRDGFTPLHKAAHKGNYDALKILLDLGSSANYKDSKGLTPLYYSVLHSVDPYCCELLLHDHAHIGVPDAQGWQEVHQACRYGRVQHLEHLLFYGSDMNAKNASGNTPLHVCAVNNQESCARVLLFRGADKDAINFANQTPYQVAVIAGNLDLAEVLKNHSPDHVVPFRETPKYNPRRRFSTTLNRALSEPGIFSLPPPASPSLSNHSLPPFSSASSLSDGSSNRSSNPSHHSEDQLSSGIVTDKSSSTSDSPAPTIRQRLYQALPNRTYIAIKNYSPKDAGELELRKGDVVEVLSVGEQGYWEGRVGNRIGWFSSDCVQEVFNKLIENEKLMKPKKESFRYKRLSLADSKKISDFGVPRTIILRRSHKGFGFVLRGAKSTSPMMELVPSPDFPSLQYLDDVDKGGVADKLGLRPGDFLLEINGVDVSRTSHEEVVNLIRRSGDTVTLTVVTLGHKPSSPNKVREARSASVPSKKKKGRRLTASNSMYEIFTFAPMSQKHDRRAVLTLGRIKAMSMVAGLAEIEALDRSISEFDARSFKNSCTCSSLESLNAKTASIRSRPISKRITTAELEEIFARQGPVPKAASEFDRHKPIIKMPKVFGSVSEMKRMKALHKNRADTLRLRKDFHSTPDLNCQEEEDYPYCCDSFNQCLKCSSHEDINQTDEYCNETLDHVEDDIEEDYIHSDNLYMSMNALNVQLNEKHNTQRSPLIKTKSHPPLPPSVNTRQPTSPHVLPPAPPPNPLMDVNASNPHLFTEVADSSQSIPSTFRPDANAKLNTGPLITPEMLSSVHLKAAQRKFSLGTGKNPDKTVYRKSRSNSLPGTENVSEVICQPASTKEGRFFALKSSPQSERLSKSKLDAKDSNCSPSANQNKSLIPNANCIKVEAIVHAPQNKKGSFEEKMFIPEPDYDTSDEEAGKASSKSSDSSVGAKLSEAGCLSNESMNSENSVVRRKETPKPALGLSMQEAIKMAAARRKSQIESGEVTLDIDSKIEENKRNSKVLLTIENNVNPVTVSSSRSANKPPPPVRTSSRDNSARLQPSVPLKTNNGCKHENKSVDTVSSKSTNAIRNNISNSQFKDLIASKAAEREARVNANKMAETEINSNSITFENNLPGNPESTTIKSHIHMFNKKEKLIQPLNQAHQNGQNNNPVTTCSLEKHKKINLPGNVDDGNNNGFQKMAPPQEFSNEVYIQNVANSQMNGKLENKHWIIKSTENWIKNNNMPSNEINMSVPPHGLDEGFGEEMPDISPDLNLKHSSSRQSLEQDSVSIVSSLSTLSTLSSEPNDFSTSHMPSHSLWREENVVPSEFPPPPSPSSLHSVFHIDIIPLPPTCELIDEATVQTLVPPPPPQFSDDVSHLTAPVLPPPIDFSSIDDVLKECTSYNELHAEKPKHESLVAQKISALNGIFSGSSSPPSKTTTSPLPFLVNQQKQFKVKHLSQWTYSDVGHWLDFIFLPEYKERFLKAEIDGSKLSILTKDQLVGLGITNIGQRLTIERSLKKYKN